MRKRILAKINLLLGAVSLSLAGCHTTSKAPAPVKYGPFNEPKKYGPPVEVVRAPEEEAPIEEPPAPPASPQFIPQQEEPVVCKYGVPAE
jgi:hypothetical protein